jgi:hypothetical protein
MPARPCVRLTSRRSAARSRHRPLERPSRVPPPGLANRRSREPPSDAEIERGLRERAVSDPRAAEIPLRWLQRPRAEERVRGVDLDSMSERELERLYAGLLKLAVLADEEPRALVESLLGGRALDPDRLPEGAFFQAKTEYSAPTGSDRRERAQGPPASPPEAASWRTFRQVCPPGRSSVAESAQLR